MLLLVWGSQIQDQLTLGKQYQVFLFVNDNGFNINKYNKGTDTYFDI